MNRKSVIFVWAAFVILNLSTICAAKDLNFALVVKSLGNGFFEASRKGAMEAATEIGGIKIHYTGPPTATAKGQISIIRQLIAGNVDGIIISANDPDALAIVCGQAMDRGIPVMSYDSCIAPKGRIVHFDPSDAGFIGSQQVELMGQAIGFKGQFAIVSASPKAANQNEWIGYMKEALQKNDRYKDMELVAVTYGYDLAHKSYRQARDLLNRFPDLKGIEAPTAIGLPAVGRAIIDAKKVGSVYVTGLGLPSEVAGLVKKKVVKSFALWNPVDLGYSSVYIMKSLIDKTVTGKKGEVVTAGRIGQIKVLDNGMMIMGQPFVFDAQNIDLWSPVF